jgi:hypothetical protein
MTNMDWLSFFIGFCTMGGFWLTALIGGYLAFQAKKKTEKGE